MNLFEQTYDHNDFEKIANIILNQLTLNVKNKKFRICEIEMYLRSDAHPDTYTHSNPDQQAFGKFYFHKYATGSFKSGTWKGIDIVLGGPDKFFGILIRSMMNLETCEFVEGPCKCVNMILAQFGLTEVKELFQTDIYTGIKQIGLNDAYICLNQTEMEKTKIYMGPRIGLSDKYPEYANKNYRYATFIEKIKKNRKTFVQI